MPPRSILTLVLATLNRCQLSSSQKYVSYHSYLPCNKVLVFFYSIVLMKIDCVLLCNQAVRQVTIRASVCSNPHSNLHNLVLLSRSGRPIFDYPGEFIFPLFRFLYYALEVTCTMPMSRLDCTLLVHFMFIGASLQEYLSKCSNFPV